MEGVEVTGAGGEEVGGRTGAAWLALAALAAMAPSHWRMRNALRP